MGESTFSDIWEGLKSSGERERRAFEAAEEVANIINGISEERIRRGLTQTQLAELCGMKQAAIGRFEAVQSIPRLDTVVKIANALDLHICVQSQAEMRAASYIYTRKSTLGYRPRNEVYKFGKCVAVTMPA
ncbi:MAG: helix-turn-helix transcriptional regulator [Oscillospiraceae bacterium]|nr:helix-turn-helix transcriptional regulator [Oscillospiraceae bacterium]